LSRREESKKGDEDMKKIITMICMIFACSVFVTANAMQTHKVEKGDTMWKIAVRYEVGLSEIISANPQITNSALIYPGQILNIPSLSASVTSYEKEVVRLVNDIRAKNGLSPLREDWELSRVARIKSQDMLDRNYFSHTSPTYGSPFQMIKNFGIAYKSAAENIAKGQRTPSEVVNAWMNSSGHRANILNKSFTKISHCFLLFGGSPIRAISRNQTLFLKSVN
jgi:uncharacterized YkwD family protein/spore coat assembly protein SafA